MSPTLAPLCASRRRASQGVSPDEPVRGSRGLAWRGGHNALVCDATLERNSREVAPALHTACRGLGLLAGGPFPRLLEDPLLVERPARLVLLLPPPLPGALLWDLWLTERGFLLCCFPFHSLMLAEKTGMEPSVSHFAPEKMTLVNWEERAKRWQGTAFGQAPSGELGHPPPYLHRAERCPPGPLLPTPSPCDPLPDRAAKWPPPRPQQGSPHNRGAV